MAIPKAHLRMMMRRFPLRFAWVARLVVLALILAGFAPAMAAAPVTMQAPMAMMHDMTSHMTGHDHAAMMAATHDMGKKSGDHSKAPNCLGKALACCPAMVANLAEPVTGPINPSGPRLFISLSHALEDHPVAPLPDPPRSASV